MAKSKAVKTNKYKSQFEFKLATQIATITNKTANYEPIKLLYIEKESTYTPDFILPNGIVIEAKGYFDTDARAKMTCVRRQYPDLDIRFVFQNAYAKLSKTSPTTYAGWAEKWGFKWANGLVPPDWFNEPASGIAQPASKTIHELIEIAFRHAPPAAKLVRRPRDPNTAKQSIYTGGDCE